MSYREMLIKDCIYLRSACLLLAERIEQLEAQASKDSTEPQPTTPADTGTQDFQLWVGQMQKRNKKSKG